LEINDVPLSTNKPGGAGAATASSGEPEHWQAVLPTLTPVGQPFRLCLKAEGDWGSPDGGAEATVRLETERPVQGLPETVTVTGGEPVKIIEGLTLAEECDLSIRVRGPSGSVLVESNPCRVSDAYPYSVRWSRIGEAPGGPDLALAYPGTATDVAVLEAASGAAQVNRSNHFATTGARIFLEAAILEDTFTLDLSAASPVERIELRQEDEVLEVMRPFGKRDLGARVRVIWEGAESAAGGPPVRWDGNLYIHGNRIRQAKPINFPPDASPLETRGDLGLAWKAVASGGFGGVDLWLEDAKAGRLEIETPQGRFEILLEDVGLDDMRFDLGGQGKALRVYRLPERLTAKTLKWSRSLAGCRAGEGGTGLYACVTFEDGHQAWSSPV
jgi:hypothetical protein